MDENVIRLVLQQLGFEGLERIRADAAKTRAGIAELGDQFKRGDIDASAYEKGLGKASSALERQESLLAMLEKAQEQANAATTAASSATSDLGHKTEVTSAQLAAMKAQQAQLVVQTKELGASFISGKISGDQFNAGLQKISQTSATLKSAEGALKGVTSGMAGFGQSALQTGRVIQDFAQGGLGGVLNNIEGLTMALGLGSGLAGILTIVGVAFLVLKPQITEAAKSLGLFGDSADGAKDKLAQLNDRIKELTEKPHLIPIEMRELNAAKDVVDSIKKALAAVEAMRNSQTESESKSGKATHESLTQAKDDSGNEIGAQAVLGKLRQQVVREMEAQADADAKKLRDAIQGEIDSLTASMPSDERSSLAIDIKRQELEVAERAAASRRARITIADGDSPAEADRALGSILATAEKGAGEAQAKAQQQLAARLRQAGLKNAGGQVAMHSAGYERDASAAKDSIEEGNRRVKDKEDKAKADADAKEKAVKLAEDLADQDEEIRKAVAEGNAENARRKADAQKKTDATAKAAQKKADADSKKHANELATQYSRDSDVDEQARMLGMQLQAQGGMTPAEIQAEVERQVVHYLQVLRVNLENARAASGPIARKALGAEFHNPVAPVPASDPDDDDGDEGNRHLKVVIPPGLLDNPGDDDTKIGVRRRQKRTTRKQGVTTHKRRRGPTPDLKGGNASNNVTNEMMRAGLSPTAAQRRTAEAVARAKTQQDAAQAARQQRTAAGMSAGVTGEMLKTAQGAAANTGKLVGLGAAHNAQLKAIDAKQKLQQQQIDRLNRDSATNTRSLQRNGR
jgi:hypothetical protein